MLRISTTTLESFRLFMQPDQEWMSEADLLATIRGEFVPTEEIRIGRAFDDVLTDPDRYRVAGGYEAGGYFFHDVMIEPALMRIDRRGVTQVKTTKRYGDALVVSKADQIVGLQIIENKSRWGQFDFDKYAESCQWRFMVDAFDAQQVTYRVYMLGIHKQTGEIGCHSTHEFDLYPYVGLHDDCARLVDRFVAYVRARGLAPLLEERQAAADARGALVG